MDVYNQFADFLFNDLSFFDFIPQFFYWKRGLHIFTYNLKYEPTKSKYKK